MSETRSDKLPVPKGRARNHSRRWLPYLGGVVIVAAIAIGLWPQPVPVETVAASMGTLRATVNEEGKTRIKQRYVISAPVTGQLRRIPFKVGAEVRAEETVLAIIDPQTPALLDARARRLAEARRDTAAANADKARDSHDFAASELRRFEKLFAEKTVSVQERETAQWREASAARDLAAAESALRQAEAELAEFSPGAESGTHSNRPPREVKSPANGKVLRVFEENAGVVLVGKPLLEIGDPADLEAVIEVLSRDGASIAPGAKVEFDQWGKGEPLQGRVRLVEPAAFTKVSALGVEEQRVNVIADLTASPTDRPGLGDGFRVEARIVVWESADTLKLPTGALFRRGDQWATFVVADGRAHLRPVKVGRSSGNETQVLEGLKNGDLVIVYPGSRVQDGIRVKQIRI
jgi:HlyD family secretion protein